MSSWHTSLIKEPPPVEVPKIPEKTPEEEYELMINSIFSESTKGNIDPWIEAIQLKKLSIDYFDKTGFTVLHVSV